MSDDRYFRITTDRLSESNAGDIIKAVYGGNNINLSTTLVIKERINYDDCDQMGTLSPIYKGKSIKVIILHDKVGVVTLRSVKGQSTKVHYAKVVANKTNDAEVVAKNKAKLKRKNYLRGKGYSVSREKAKKRLTSLENCTLLKKWDDVKDKIKYPIVGSGKIDGIRATVYGDGVLMSRGGLEVHANHITKQVGLGRRMDGELYIPGADLETIQSIVSKVGHLRKQELHYFIFDKPKAIPFIGRLEHLERDRKVFSDNVKYPNVHIVPQIILNNEEEADKFYRDCLDVGYEGVVYRTLDGIYIEGRTKDVVKRKPMHSAEFKITQVLYDKDNLIYFEVECSAGTFKSIPKWSDAVRAKGHYVSHDDEYLGQYAEIEYQDKTKYGIPKFTNVKAIRETRVTKEGHVELVY